MSAISIERYESDARRSGLVRSMPIEGDRAASSALAVVRDEFDRRPKTVARILDTEHSETYIRQLLNGERAIPLPLYSRLLLAMNRESARRSLQAIANENGLDVVFRSDSQVKDVKSEIVDAAAAVGRAFAEVQMAIADGNVTDEEKARVESFARAAMAQLDEMVRSIQ